MVILGQLPISLNQTTISNWKSDIFEIVKPIDHIGITKNADGKRWEYLDNNIESQLPKTFEGDFLIAITRVPLEDNYYARRFSNNRICMTFYEMADILKSSNIPFENLIYRLLYSYCLIYKRYGNRIPPKAEVTSFTHDETRGCLFDMNGIKSDIIYSTDKPIICKSCVVKLINEKVPENEVETLQKELKRITKGLYFQILDFIKNNPIWTLIISSLTAIILGTIGSVIASILYEKIK